MYISIYMCEYKYIYTYVCVYIIFLSMAHFSLCLSVIIFPHQDDHGAPESVSYAQCLQKIDSGPFQRTAIWNLL